MTEPVGGLGGVATSSSVLNLLRRPGYSTGSTWTLHEYLTDAVQADDDGEEDD